MTFPYEQTLKGEAPQAFPAEFDALIDAAERAACSRASRRSATSRRRAKVFGFPQQMARCATRSRSSSPTCSRSTRFDQQILLRGVYFTSGTQEGTPIDRLLGAIGRRFARGAGRGDAPAGRGKAYFIERLLKDVLFAESGLAGVNRRFEVQKAAAQLGAYVAMARWPCSASSCWSVSYSRNRTYVDEVGADVAQLQQAPPAPARAVARRGAAAARCGARGRRLGQPLRRRARPGRCAGDCIRATRSATRRATPTSASSTARCCRASRRCFRQRLDRLRRRAREAVRVSEGAT